LWIRALAGATTPALVNPDSLGADGPGRLTHCDAAWAIVRGPDGDRVHGASSPPAGEPAMADDHLDAVLAADGPVIGFPAAVPAVLREALGEAPWLALPLRSGELTAGALILRGRTAHAGDADGTSTVLVDQVDIAHAHRRVTPGPRHPRRRETRLDDDPAQAGSS
jgi:hypothetical protein